MARTSLGLALLGGAFFFFLATFAIGSASTALPDWIYQGDSSNYLHQGLWSTCWAGHCFPINHDFLNCQSILDTVRAFSIMTLVFAFLTLTAIFILFFVHVEWLWILILILAVITTLCSIVPWTVYFAYVGPDTGCQWPFTKGSGWALAVAAFPIATVGLLLVIAWIVLGRPPAADPVPPHMHISGDRRRIGVGLLATSAFFYALEWVLSTAAAPSTNWATLNVAGVHQGLWVTCTFNKCDNLVDGTDYTGQCLAFLNTTRIFNILSILLGFFAMVLVILLLFLTSPILWLITLIVGVLAVLVAVIPWTVYGLGLYGIGLFSSCVPGYLQPGGGWALAVAAFVMSAVGLIFLVAWLIVGTRHGFHAPAVAKSPEVYPVDPSPLGSPLVHAAPPVGYYGGEVATYTTGYAPVPAAYPAVYAAPPEVYPPAATYTYAAAPAPYGYTAAPTYTYPAVVPTAY